MGCECCDGDECGTPASASASASVPPDIRDAVDEHKNSRKRKLSDDNPSVFEGRGSYTIRQNRELVKREDGFSIWRLDLPVCTEDNGGGGDPIVEYRNNHRIIFVEKLNEETSHVLSIGQGIIGSAAEEHKRKRVHWESGSSYLLPCSKGIACGWIHKPATAAADDTENGKSENITSTTTTTSSTTNNAYTEDVVIYSLKASPETLLGMKDKNLDKDVSCWVKLSYELFQQRLAKSSQLQTHDDDGGGQKKENSEDVENEATDDISLTEEESMTMSLIIELAK